MLPLATVTFLSVMVLLTLALPNRGPQAELPPKLTVCITPISPCFTSSWPITATNSRSSGRTLYVQAASKLAYNGNEHVAP